MAVDIWRPRRSFWRSVDAFPLTTLLALRHREEEAAEGEWSAARAAVRAAQARLEGLTGEIEAARGRLDQARRQGEQVAEGPASQAATWQRFVTRRRDEWTAALAAAATFREGPLLAAQQRERATRDAHADRRRARELVDKQRDEWAAAARRQAERREEDARDDLTASRRHGPRDP